MMLPGKKYGVLGLGISGVASAQFLKTRGYEVFASEIKADDDARRKKEELAVLGIEAEVGGHSAGALAACDGVVVSPGIPASAEVLIRLRERGVPVYSEIEIASRFCPSKKVIAVTGSCGKTTVSTILAGLFADVFKESQTVLCGNVGMPWIGCLEGKTRDDFFVVEVSSFQLAFCETFRPHVAVLLNVYPNHLDWHASMEDYAWCKARIFQRQTEADWALFRREDRAAYFSKAEIPSQKCLLDASAAENPNWTAVKNAAKVYGIPEPAAKKYFDAFPGIEHRMETVLESRGVRVINDSKSTTPASLVWALSRLPDQSVLLIAGGKPKSAGFDAVKPMLEKKVKRAFLIGAAKPVLQQAWAGSCPLTLCGDLRDAAAQALQAAQAGHVILLSPACASFDMFESYQDRGRQFKACIAEMTAGAKHV